MTWQPPDKQDNRDTGSPKSIISTDSKIVQFTWHSRFKRTSIYAKCFLIAATFHTSLFILIGIISFAWDDLDDVYGSLLVFVAVCFFLFVIQGILKENTFQLNCALMSIILCTVYACWFYFVDGKQDVVGVVGILSTLLCVLYCMLYYFVIRKFGWYRYNKLQTTNAELLELYYDYQRFKATLLLDCEVCMMLIILILAKLKHSEIGLIGNGLCIFIQCCWAFIGEKAIRTEHVTITKSFMATTIFLVIYVAINIYWVEADDRYASGTTPTQFYVLGLCVVMVRALTMYWTYRAMNNFGQGLCDGFADLDIWNVWGTSTEKFIVPLPRPADDSGHLANDDNFAQRLNSDEYD